MLSSDLIERAQRLHRENPVVECHTDITIDVWRRRRAGEPDPLCNDYSKRLRAGGVDVQFVTAGGDQPLTMDAVGRPDVRALEIIDDVQAEVAGCPDLRIVRDWSDVEAVMATDEIGLVLHFEGCMPIRGQLELLRNFHRLGLRSVQLTWNPGNELADGVGEPDPRGLTDAGREVVAELDRLGILIDVSHLAAPGFWGVVEAVRRPIVASHANAASLCPHPRNLTDEQISAIAESGGYVGACFFPAFIGDPPTLGQLLDHVDHIVELVGIEHVAVGPDYVEYARDLMAADMSYGESTVDYGPALDFPDGLERVETLPNFTAGLLDRGYSEDDVKKILGENALRVCDQVWA